MGATLPRSSNGCGSNCSLVFQSFSNHLRGLGHLSKQQEQGKRKLGILPPEKEKRKGSYPKPVKVSWLCNIDIAVNLRQLTCTLSPRP